MRSSQLSVVVALLGITTIAGCSDHPFVSEPARPAASGAHPTVSDGSTLGNSHFFFLPPLQLQPTFWGISDATLNPIVQVCDLGITAATPGSRCVGGYVATFTGTAGTSSEIVRYDAPNQLYIVNWKLDASSPALQNGHTYRVAVRVLGRRLGFIDITLSGTGSLRNAKTGDVIPLVDGRTLPVKFRIEGGALEHVQTIALEFSTALMAKGQPLDIGVTLRDAVGNSLTGLELDWTSADPGVVQVDPYGGTGQLLATGPGTTTITGILDGVQTSAVVTVVTLAAITAGPNTCAITIAGKVYCAGRDYGPLARRETAAPQSTAVSSNGAEQCVLAVDQTAYCWGGNGSGQLGVGDLISRATPTKVAGGLQFASLSVGRDYVCALTTGGSAYCWGNGATGQLGTGNTNSSSVPVAVAGRLTFSQLDAGSGTTCGVTISGQAYCWGRNDLGQLGSQQVTGGHIPDLSALPVAVDGAGSTSLIVTKGPKTCLLNVAGNAYCFGNNTVYELGVGPSGAQTLDRCYGGKPCSLTPRPVATTAVFISLAASQFATCGLTMSKQTLCWGMDFEYLFGSQPGVVPDCQVSGALYPCTSIPLPGAAGFISLTATTANQCGFKDDGVAYCWGGNGSGQRGWLGSAPDPVPHPFSIAPGATP